MRVTSKTVGSIAMAGVVLAAAACGGPSSDESSGGDEGGGYPTLTVGVEIIPTTLDPGQNFSRAQYSIVNLISGTLTTVDSTGKQISMGLAESVEGGDERYVVKLKPDLKFSDGTPLTATDVAASFEHYLGDETNGYGYTFAAIDKVTAVDELTVNFDLKQPDPSMPFWLSLPSSAILPSEAVEAKGKNLYKGDPVPTAGQFQVGSFDQNQITLQANPNYAGAQSSTKTLVFKKIADPATRLAQLQGGELDFADTISPKQVGRLAAPIEVRATRSVIGEYLLTLNNRDNSVLSDVRIRQAIGVAIDRDQINQVAYAGLSKPVLSLWGTDSQYSDPFLPAAPDVARAEELLAGTQCADGCTLRLIAPSDNEALADTGLVVQQNLEAIGIDAKVVTADAATLGEWGADGNFDIRVGGSYDVADFPDGYLAFTLASAYGALYSGYSSPEMDRLINDVSVSSGSARDAAVDGINALFEEDLPLVPTVDFVVVSASRVPSDVFDVGATLYYYVGE